ncbi:MAG: FecR domain-containing protein [Deltaproteobacteria bacterium]|nr:FecR domain-containing protein [Deltaproteobacteria bacterium]
MKKTFTGSFGKAYGLAAVIGAVFLFMLCSALPGAALAGEAGPADVGYISKLDGKADLTRAGSAQAVTARQGDKVSVGDVVRTKPGSKAELTFNDKTVVRLAPESRVKIDEYLFNPDGGRKKASLYLFRGKVRGVVSTFKKKVIPVSISESTFNIQTPTAIAGVRGTDLFVFYLRGTTGVVFNDGLGFVYNPRLPGQVVDIRAGQSTFILHPEAPPLPPKRALNIEFLKHSSDTAIEDGGDNGANGDAEGGDEAVSGDEGTATTAGASTGEGGQEEGEADDNGIASLAETGSESFDDDAGELDSSSSRSLSGLTETGGTIDDATEYSDLKPISETSAEALGTPDAPTVTVLSSSLNGFIRSPDADLDVQGAVAFNSGETTGTWYFDIDGWAGSPPDNEGAITVGGSGQADSSSGTTTGYWLSVMSGSYSNGLMSGAGAFYYLTGTSLISGDGTVNGSYDSSTGSFSGSAAGTATEDDLAFVTVLYSQGLLSGLMGGTSSIWGTSRSSPAPMIMIGRYLGGITPRLWLNQNAFSLNFSNSTYTTYDGGAFFGYSAMLAAEGSANSSLYALYIDPSGNAGIAVGNLSGSFYYETGMMKMEGSVFPAQIRADAYIPYTASNLPSNISGASYQSSVAPAYPAISGASSSFTGGSAWDISTSSIAGQDWGILESIGNGTYTSSGPVSGALTLDFYNDGYNSSTMIAGARGDLTVGAGNTITGGFVGYGARQDTADSWISAGEFLGTFSPANYTWQSIQTGAWIETSLFISMTQTAAGQASLQALDIPYAEVGRANLTGTDGNLTVNMNDVTFFAYSSGASPKVWATNNISGSYVTDPLAGASVALSGNGLSSSFNVKQWSTSTWLSSVSGAGTYSGTGTLNGSSVNMVGAAAGTYSGGTFSGTGAGAAY